MLEHGIKIHKAQDDKPKYQGIIKEEILENKNTNLKSETIPTFHEPIVIGDKNVQILSHHFFEAGIPDREPTPGGVQLAIRNISQNTIATIVFKTAFYDSAGNIVEEIKHTENELKPSSSRSIIILSSIIGDAVIRSHDTKIIKTITTDIERVQLRGYGMKTNEKGEEEIQGTVKNISDLKTSSALIANFYDYDNDHVGSKVFCF